MAIGCQRLAPGPEPLSPGPVAEWHRHRRIRVPIELPGGGAPSLAVLAASLERPERPLRALLAPERLEGPAGDPEGPALFLYRSAPFRLLGLRLMPELRFEAIGGAGRLHLVSRGCRIEGLGRWREAVRFRLEATLSPYEAGVERGVEGVAAVALISSLVGWDPGRRLGERALDQVLERIERRLRRGLGRGAGRWLVSSGPNPGPSG